jgi:Na+/melibiose symporter-like transporter
VLCVNVLPGALLLFGALRYLLNSVMAEKMRLDLLGAVCVTAGLGALTAGLSEASHTGWGSPTVVIPLIVAAILLVAFVVVEVRSPHPMIPGAIVRPRNLRVANVLMLCMGVTLTAMMFFLSLYCQQALGYSALRTGMAMLPVTVVFIIGGLTSRHLIGVFGPRRVLVAGGLIAVVGIVWLATLPTHSAYLSHILAPNLVGGFGVSVMLLGVTISGTAGVDPANAGAASGLLNTSRQIGGAVGLAVLVNVAARATAQAANHSDRLEALVHGYRVALLVNAALVLVAALTALALSPAKPAEEKAPAESLAERPDADVVGR